MLSAVSQEMGLLSSNGQILRDDESIVVLVLVLMLGWTIAMGLAVLVVLETLVPTVFRTLGSLEGTLRRLDPGLDLVDAARDVGRELFVDRLAPHRLRPAQRSSWPSCCLCCNDCHAALDALAHAAQAGRLSVQVRVLADPDDRAFVKGLVRQMTMSVIAGALSLSAVLLILARGGRVRARLLEIDAGGSDRCFRLRNQVRHRSEPLQRREVRR